MHRDKEFYIKLGWVIKSQRELKNRTITEAAQWVNVSWQQFCKYESGENRIPVDRLQRFCDLVNVEVSWVIEWARKVKRAK